MCTYNGGSYLQEQLDSIAMQSRLPDELIICDDRSSDNTREIIETFASQTSFPVRLHVNERNLGSTKNFEKAIGLCDGDIIALSDQDDVWHSEKLRRLEAALLSIPKAGMVFSDAEVVDEGLRPLGYSVWQCPGIEFNQTTQRLFKEGKAFDVLLGRNVATGAAIAFRAKYKELFLPIPGDLIQNGLNMIHDGWIALMIAAVADLSFIDEPLIKYRQHSKQQLGLRLAVKANVLKPRSGNLRAIVQRKNFYLDEIYLLKTVYERLIARANSFDCKIDMSNVKAKIVHLQSRDNMPERKLSRVPYVLKELLTLRYHLYSNGIYSAAKDLLS
ncbi:MAG TPA: glycosyltransferase family 2 protein, partial [Blastocatellia bacterium]|nr:glycosyltransferase family 2 protein [Blastocatellia bacterium]